MFKRRFRLLAANARDLPGTFAPDIDRGNVERRADNWVALSPRIVRDLHCPHQEVQNSRRWWD